MTQRATTKVPTTISVSYRSQSKTNKNKLCINLAPSVVGLINIQGKRHAIVETVGKVYRVKFTNESTSGFKTQISESKGIQLFVDDGIIPVKSTDQIRAIKYSAVWDPSSSSIEFEFDPKEFIDRPTNQKITSRADKEQAGFVVDSAWGEKLDEAIDEDIKALQMAYLRAKVESWKN